MNKHVITLSKSALLLFLVFASLNIYAQTEPTRTPLKAIPQTQKDERVSDGDLIKLATKAPFRENFSSDQDYSAAKEAWIAGNADANKRMSGPKPQPSAEDLKATEQQQIADKEAWIAAHPEEYARMLKGTP